MQLIRECSATVVSAEPLWTDPGLKSRISVHELILTSKEKKSAGREWMVKDSLKNSWMRGKSHHHHNCSFSFFILGTWWCPWNDLPKGTVTASTPDTFVSRLPQTWFQHFFFFLCFFFFYLARPHQKWQNNQVVDCCLQQKKVVVVGWWWWWMNLCSMFNGFSMHYSFSPST